MSQKFITVEHCDCQDNEKETRRILEVVTGSSDDELQVTELLQNGVRLGPERVTKGQVTTQFGRTFDKLFKLGPGLHNICDCQQIGPKDAVTKSRED